MYFNLVRQGIAPSDIKFLYYSDAGLNIYGNAILASKKMLDGNPKAVRGFVAATAKGWRDAIANPAAAIAALKKRSSLVDEKLETAKLEWLIKNQLVTDESKADGLGGVRAERLAASLETVVEGVRPRQGHDARGRLHRRLPAGRRSPQAALTAMPPFVDIADVTPDLWRGPPGHARA